MQFDHLTKAAIRHTLHCLAGCSVGEILGMVITTALGWSNTANIIVSVLLAFFFGYLFTIWSLSKNGAKPAEAIKTAVATDTTSIISMETVDNIFIILIPGAINAGLSSILFWWSLIASLAVAFFLTIPVNRWFIARSPVHHHE